MQQETTICAISTPIGTGGVSIVRMSGEQALAIAQKFFTCNWKKQNDNQTNEIKPRKMYLGTFSTLNFKEKCLLVYFKAPFSYTGEDVVEFQCHGGVVITKEVLNTLLSGGAQLAAPGEFTKRAFLNGKITLDEAEGVMDMINAESQTEVRAGYQLMQGGLSQEIVALQDEITTLLAQIEVTLDYPEVDYEEQTAQVVNKQLKAIKSKIEDILATSQTGMLVKNGTRVLILGKPNVGKSSLLNAMLNYDRAIVTNIQGTTRDTIEETYVYKGVKFVLTDTAGLRDSHDEIEKIGIEKSKKAIKESDLLLLVLDASQRLSQEDKEIMKLIKNEKNLVVLNKTDLGKALTPDDVGAENLVEVSALNKNGINSLKEKIYQMVFDQNILSSNLLITNLRHVQTLESAVQHCQNALTGLQQHFSLDLISIDIRSLWLSLGQITGQNSNEEIIDRIFAKFCLGK